MRPFLISVFFAFASAYASDPEFLYTRPDVVNAIVEGLQRSQIERLTPRISTEGNKRYSYYLSSVRYLGSISRGSEFYLLATAFFVRSSAQKSDFPPARGHGFLLCFTTSYSLISYCELDSPDRVILDRSRLLLEGQEIADFTRRDASSRSGGFLVNGDDRLPYPFTDRLEESPAD